MKSELTSERKNNDTKTSETKKDRKTRENEQTNEWRIS